MTNNIPYQFQANARQLFHNLLVPRAVGKKGKGKGKEKYGITVGIPEGSPDVAAIKQAAVEAHKLAGLSTPIKDMIRPWRTGAEAMAKAKADGKDPSIYEGYAMIFTSRSGFEVKLGVLLGSKISDINTEALKATVGKQKFYNGCFVIPHVSFKGYEGTPMTNNLDGVTAYLNGVLWVADGEKLKGSGGGGASDMFSGHVSADTADDEDGDDPFA